jgi:haloalkane dehalogenase
MTVSEFRSAQRFVDTGFGRIACIDRGHGPVAVFLHGLPLNGYFWRDVVEALAAHRRCLAPDLMGLGYTEISESVDVSPVAQSEMILSLLDALSIDTVDLVGNDSGGAVAQLIAVRQPWRVRTLLLTNCDVHENCPPPLLAPVVAAAQQGIYADEFVRHVTDPAFARSPNGIGGICYSNPVTLTDASIDCYFTPLLESPGRRRQFNRYIGSFVPNPLPAIESGLREFRAPARILWGTADPVFDRSWATWLDKTLPGSRGIRWIDRGRLFFPEELPQLVADEVRRLWR